jgi:hypothetical protein
MKVFLFFVFIFLFQELLAEGRLYDQLNQYFVNCRLTKEARVEPFFGEDAVKCFYTCTDKVETVITSHSNYTCYKEIVEPRGESRDWRDRKN